MVEIESLGPPLCALALYYPLALACVRKIRFSYDTHTLSFRYSRTCVNSKLGRFGTDCA